MTNANVNNIMEILAAIGTANIQQDTMSEFTETVNKEDLVEQNKKSTHAKWVAWDVITSLGGMVINQYRQKQFQHLQENAEAKADEQLKERQQKLDNLKANLGITDLEQKIQKQDETLQNITKMLSHLVAEQKKEKREVNLPSKIKY